MANKDYNLDDQSYEEFFTFQIENQKYKFRYLNGDEYDNLSKEAKKVGNNSLGTLFDKYITPIDESKPFLETWKIIISPKIIRLKNMIMSELSGEDQG